MFGFMFYVFILKGSGVFKKRSIMKGDFICQYHGEQLSEKDGENRRDNYQDKDGNFVYFFEHDGQKLWFVLVEFFYFIDCSVYYCILQYIQLKWLFPLRTIFMKNTLKCCCQKHVCLIPSFFIFCFVLVYWLS